jgi:hypothetical protein
MKRISGNYINKHLNPVDFDIMLPSDWAELDAQTYATILQLLTYRNADKYTIAVSILSLLFGPRNFHILESLPDEDIHTLVELTNFSLETIPPATNRFPKIRSRKKEFIAPADDLSNLGFGEWCFAYQFYTYYVKTQDPVWLDKLIATVYRPQDPAQDSSSVDYTGDMRERFNENLIETRAAGLRDIEERRKAAIFGWLSSAFIQVQNARPNAFPEPEKDEEGNIKVTDTIDSRTWLTVFRELLGPKWGTVEQLKYTNAMFVLDHMEEQQLEFNSQQTPS